VTSLADFPRLLLDGATGTELARRGIDVALPLWSARALIDAPAEVERVHADYLAAGADAVTTCTFRTHRRSLAKAGMGDRAAELTKRAVNLARRARDRAKPGALVLGSVAPLEDCYRPDLAPPAPVALVEHGAMIRQLLAAGADAILIETMGTVHEAIAAAEAARRLAAGRWMISFCVKSEGPPGILQNGRGLTDALTGLGGAAAVGVNCVAAPAVLANVRLLRRLLPPSVRVMAYGNVGQSDETGAWTQSDAVTPRRYAELARSWEDAGATIIGGCCGTTPETIAAMAPTS
jgi:S-methylmethionine-dependent homocysteine/selenocysteine methylase